MVNAVEPLTFLEQSIAPGVFWGALSAIGTFLAVGVALFHPIWSKAKKIKHIEKVLRAEVNSNAKHINKVSLEDLVLKGGPMHEERIPALQRNDLELRSVKLNMWLQFRYELAADNPKSYDKYNQINEQVERLISVESQHAALRLVVQVSTAEKFNQQYKKLFEK